MTHSGGQQHRVGDEGQRFEITYFDESDDERKVFGWCNTETGAEKIAGSIDKHPSWKFPEITDRNA